MVQVLGCSTSCVRMHAPEQLQVFLLLHSTVHSTGASDISTHIRNVMHTCALTCVEQDVLRFTRRAELQVRPHLSWSHVHINLGANHVTGLTREEHQLRKKE